MPRFTLKQLGYFAAVATHGGIAQAARALHLSQPAIASALDKLEDELGFKLFERRHSRGTELTPQGREALVRARWLLEGARETGSEFRAIAAESIGHLRFGCFHTLAPVHAPALVAAMKARHPGVTLDLTEGRHVDLVDALGRHDLDVALLYALQMDHDRIHAEHLHTMQPQVVLPIAHPLAALASVSLAALANQPYVMFDWPASRQYFDSVLAAGGIAPPVAFRSQSFEVMLSAVASGLGFSLLLVQPKSELTYSGARVTCRPVEEAVPALDVIAAWPAAAGDSPLRDDFVRLCHGRFAGAPQAPIHVGRR